jgi:hypothetical protein
LDWEKEGTNVTLLDPIYGLIPTTMILSGDGRLPLQRDLSQIDNDLSGY